MAIITINNIKYNVTFEKQKDSIWLYDYNIKINGIFSGYIGRTSKKSKCFIYSSRLDIHYKVESFIKAKQFVINKIKEIYNGEI